MSQDQAQRIKVLGQIFFEIWSMSPAIGTDDWKIAQDVIIHLLKLKLEENFFDRRRLLDVIYATVFDIAYTDDMLALKIRNMALKLTLKLWPKALPPEYHDREVLYEWWGKKSKATKIQKEKIIEVLGFITESWYPDK